MNDDFEVISEISAIEIVAVNKSIRELRQLRKMFGRGRWRKLKGVARIRLPDGVEGRRSFTGTRRTASANESSKSNAIWIKTMNDQVLEKAQFAICIHDGGYPEALEVMKLYQVLPDADAARHNQLRVVDESGEDYLYFANLFIKIDFPFAIERVLTEVASRV